MLIKLNVSRRKLYNGQAEIVFEDDSAKFMAWIEFRLTTFAVRACEVKRLGAGEVQPAASNAIETTALPIFTSAQRLPRGA